MSPEAQNLDRELKRMHVESPFPQPPKPTWATVVSNIILQGATVVILMAIGGAITVAALSYYGWITFPRFYM